MRLSVAVLGMLLGCGCDPPGYRLVLRAHADDDRALAAGTFVSAHVIDRQTRGGMEVASVRLSSDLGTASPVELELPLNGGGQYDAHLLVVAPAGSWYATRCYQIGGVVTSDVLLVGPIEGDEDDDGDGWPPRDRCVDPGGGPCADPCPPIRADDCNDRDREISPGATDLCQDQIDQDCSGNDALCGEDEGGP